jgi:hypothetical protein
MRIETNVSSPPLNFPGKLFPAALPLMEVDLDEPVEFMQENYAAGPGGVGVHRYNVMFIPLGNMIAAFWTDLGSIDTFKVKKDDDTYVRAGINQFVAGAHSVDECIHMAVEFRDDDWPIEVLHDQVHSSDLWEKYRRMIELDMELVRNRSSFGPYQRTERNGYSPLFAREERLRKGLS